MIKPVSFRWSTELVARIDLRRGDVPRTIWVRRAVERALGDTGAHPSSRQPPAPAEQPDADFPMMAELRSAGMLSKGVSPSKPIPPRVPFRRDVKPFQRGDK